MSYEEYANLILNESKITCEIDGTLVHRNGFTQYDYQAADSVPDKGAHFNAYKDVRGNVSLIHTNEYDRTGSSRYSSMSAGSILRNGDFIYFYNAINDGAGYDYEMQVCEYQITTGNKNYITVRHNSYWIACDISMALIEDRKLIVFDPNGDNWDPEPAYWNIYIVDFNDMSCITTLQVLMTEHPPDPYERDTIDHDVKAVASVKNDNGDIHLFVLVWYDHYNNTTGDDRGGREFYHMDYTHSPGTWEHITVLPDPPSGYYRGDGSNEHNLPHFTIVNNRYLVTALVGDWTDYQWWYTMTTLTFYVYDTLTNTTNYAHYNLLPDLQWTGGWCFIESMKVDNSNNKIYFSLSNYWNNNNITGLFEFDILTMSFRLTSIVSQDYQTLRAIGAGNNTYAYDYVNNNLYKSLTESYLSTFILPTDVENLCTICDDNGRLWYWDGATSHLKAINFSGKIVKDIDTGITPTNSYTGLIHLGDILIVTMYTTWDTSINPQYCWYYLIT